MAVAYVLRSGTTGPVVEGNADGDVLVWNAATRKWVPGPGGGGGGGGCPTTDNKQMPADTTVADGDLACEQGVAQTPATNGNASSGFISVYVNGHRYAPGNGTKVGVPCYFSGDGGATARALKSVVNNDTLYWNGSVAGFQLNAAVDVIDFDYLVE